MLTLITALMGCGSPVDSTGEIADIGSLDMTTMEKLSAWYYDGDHDGYGAGKALVAGRRPHGYTPIKGDCNDHDATIHPLATDTCGDGVDQDCDKVDGDAGGTTTYYLDADGDGYGDPSSSTSASSCLSGYVTDNTDCNDGSASVHPGATETSNGVDDNCNGTVDEGVTTGCSIRVTATGDATIEGYSTYYAEAYILPQDSAGNPLSWSYWPNVDWSVTSPSSLTEATSFSSGGTGTNTITFASSSIASVKVNGGVWTSSTGSFIRWLNGSYSDSLGATLKVEMSCSGAAYTTLTCSASGNDQLCK